MSSITLKSPAKINLYLRVLNKRKDGFHNIETIFERINLFDTIKLKKNALNEIRFFCEHPDVPKNNSNLCFKAANLLKKEFSIDKGVDITLIKRIPVAAGLGGGSSNAAFVLMGLNNLWHLRLSKKILLRLAKELGSDVAFFVSQKSFAVGRGRGERIFCLSGIKPLWHILVVPYQRLSTPRVYHKLNLKLTKNKVNVNILIHALKKNSASLLSKLVMNDLEEAASKCLPGLLSIKEKLKGLGVRSPAISGSGSAIFSLVNSRKEAQLLIKRLKNKLAADFFAVKTY
ncbi:MAG: 4-(cytidine 5'-diphospho)-2-C-methyl-D-erythritol kinase [Candidatus Omnitrophota bacterium]|nr:4-(cytidine 5'-diphospho)-2-C-methyl-D-erythritol kinase [Candidatus Omnitrophota bacterium]